MAQSMSSPANSSTPAGREPPKALFKVVNPIMKNLLRSPLHGLVSQRLALLYFTGRKSGKRYIVPIGYTEVGDTLYCGTKGGWYRNLLGGVKITVRLRGQMRPARAEVIRDEAGMLAAYQEFLPKAPHYAQILGIRLNAHGEPNQEDVTRARNEGHVVIRMQLR